MKTIERHCMQWRTDIHFSFVISGIRDRDVYSGSESSIFFPPQTMELETQV